MTSAFVRYVSGIDTEIPAARYPINRCDSVAVRKLTLGRKLLRINGLQRLTGVFIVARSTRSLWLNAEITLENPHCNA